MDTHSSPASGQDHALQEESLSSFAVDLSLTEKSACCLSRGELTEESALSLAHAFKVLSNPARLVLLTHMAKESCGPLNVNDLTEIIELSQPTVTHHLKKLESAGLITKMRQGRNMMCRIRPEGFVQMQKFLDFEQYG